MPSNVRKLVEDRADEYRWWVTFYGDVYEVIKTMDYAAGVYASVDEHLAAFLKTHKYRSTTECEQEAEVRGYIKRLRSICKEMKADAFANQKIITKEYYATLYRASKRLLRVALAAFAKQKQTQTQSPGRPSHLQEEQKQRQRKEQAWQAHKK
jgi:hypothetical protein